MLFRSRRGDRSRPHRELRGECPQYATRISVVGAKCRVVDTRGTESKPEVRRRFFSKIHSSQAIFGNFFGFFSKFFWTPESPARCVVRHGRNRGTAWQAMRFCAILRLAAFARATGAETSLQDLVFPNTSKGLRDIHRTGRGAPSRGDWEQKRGVWRVVCAVERVRSRRVAR